MRHPPGHAIPTANPPDPRSGATAHTVLDSGTITGAAIHWLAIA